ncbi:MAG TPA: Crp/Fnr family transcriptional regulator [Candidatus Avirikenella pullistercoris]|nr:Crp/Fnr family transcriptional regulator [Candidatus Avirikenella pullistercoris]
MNIHEIINRIYPMPATSVDKLKKHLSEITYPKNHHILETGKIETNIFFIKKGIARAYIPTDGKEVTFWIGKEGDTIVSLKSYVNNRPGYETVELMEDSVLYLLKRYTLYQLFKEDIHIANWGRKFAESEFLQTEEKLISLLFTNASERYTSLLENNPDLLQRIPLEHLASYLGITPVSLSRIRAKLKQTPNNK